MLSASSLNAARPVVAPAIRVRRAGARSVTAMAGPRIKVNTLQESWTKEFWGTGILLEDKELKGTNYLKRIEEKGLLSAIEKGGLLTVAEKAGVTLKLVEDLKLLSTAEKLGALSLLESAAQTDGATISSLSIPFFVIAIAAFFAIPDSNIVIDIFKYLLVLTSGGLFVGLFAGGFLVNSLNE